MTCCGPRWRGSGLREPVQVVWRQARLPVTEITLEPGPDPGRCGLLAAARAGMDLRRAPLLRLTAAAEPGTGRWLALLQVHHMVLDHAGLEMVLDEIAALLAGPGGCAARAAAVPGLRGPGPARRLRGRSTQRYFAALLGDVTEPTAPYGLLDIHQPGEARRAGQMLEAGLAGRLRALARAAVGVGGDDRAPGLGAAAGGAGRAG